MLPRHKNAIDKERKDITMSVKRAVSFLLAVFLVLPLGICSVEESAYAGSEAVSVQKEGIGGVLL